jgi:predicted amidohydrolase YtcJ
MVKYHQMWYQQHSNISTKLCLMPRENNVNKKSNLVLQNGAIYTVDRDRSWAQAVAITDDRISQVGSNSEVEPLIDSATDIIDLEGKMVLPGFVDAHAHPSHAMYLIGNINLHSLDSVEIYQKTIADYVESHPEAGAYRGGGWTDGLFPKLGPSKEILDAIVPDRPVSLVSYDGHSVWANSVTLERAGITKDTPNPEGGLIERHPDTGEPSGTLRETAMKLVDEVIPDYSLEERKNTLIAYQEMAAQAGITLVHDAMLDAQGIAAFKALEADDLLRMRFRGAITMESDQAQDEQIQTVLTERLKNTHSKFQTNTAKIFIDGVIEGGTGYLLEPYEHKPGFRGELIWDTEALKKICAALDGENIQIHFHVIGDAAAQITLDALEYAQEMNGKRETRHLVTHLQLVTPKDILRFKQLGIIGVPQPFWFKIDEYYWELALPYLGKARADIQYPMQSFINAGVIMASASDFPVTIPFDPVIAIQLGITRSEIGKTPEEILWPEERASLEDMITSFTYNGAYANFLEDDTGSIEVGKQADMVVLDQNLFEIPATEIADTKVLLTLVDGEPVYRDPAFS